MIIIIIGIIIGIIILSKIRNTYDKNKEVLLEAQYIKNPRYFVNIPIKKGIITLAETDLSKTYLSHYDEMTLCIDNIKREISIDVKSFGDGDEDGPCW